MILRCGNNPLTSLDLSNNSFLIQMFCRNSLLTNLNIKNGNTISLDSLMITNNPNLYCIEVNNINYANNNWTFANGSIDNQHYFSTNCSGTAIKEYTTNKELIKTIDILGQKTHFKKKEVLFYIYNYLHCFFSRSIQKHIISLFNFEKFIIIRNQFFYR